MQLHKFHIYIFCLALLLATSCKKSLNSLYENPDAFTSTSIELLFAQGEASSIPIAYGDAYNRFFGSFAPMLQITANNTANPVSLRLYQFVAAATNSSAGAVDFGLWANYYNTAMPALKEIEKIYQWQLTPSQQQGYKVYYEMTKVVEAWNTSRATDLFGDMPYSQAFTARNSLYNQPVILYPKFDSQESIYDSLLSDLKNAAIYFDTVQLQTSVYPAQQLLSTQDILYQGNLQEWAALANSLRLRYAMRISAADQTRAVAEITDIIQNNRPLILTNAGNAYFYNTGANSSANLFAAVQQLMPNATYASEFLVNDVMQPAADPRLPVLFYTDTSHHGVYTGMPASYASRNQTSIGYTGAYAYLNPLTFGYNYSMPVGVMIDAADVNFLLAEAAHKGYIAGGDATAATYYNTGIQQSVLAYYQYYSTAPASMQVGSGTTTYTFLKTALTAPTAAGISTWIAGSPYAYNAATAMSQIALQKLIHTNIMEMDESYAEFRRLAFSPTLPADNYNGSQLNANAVFPVRVPYPNSEQSNNMNNFDTVAAATNGNSYLSPVWWDVQ